MRGIFDSHPLSILALTLSVGRSFVACYKKVSSLCPGFRSPSRLVSFGQFGVSSAITDGQTEPADAPPDKDAEPASEKPLWYPLNRIVRLRAFEALSHREYRLLWYGQVFSSMGTWMDQVTRGWLIYELTNSALHLGMVRGIQAIPFLLLSPIAGSTADRYSRKFQVVSAQFANGFLYAVTAVLIFTGLILPWHVYVTAFLMACVQVFLQPSRAAMISDSVPAKNLTNAIGLNAVVFNMARSTGPALSGVLISLFGTGLSYAVQAVFFLLATVWTLQMRSARHPSSSRRHGGHQESFAQSILEGWKFSWNKAEVRTGILIVVFASLFMIPFSTLLPVFARDLLDVGAKGQGLLLTGDGRGRAVQFDFDRLARRQPAARHAYARRRYALWPVGRALRFLPLVSVVDLFDGSHRALPRQLPRTRANRYSSLFAAGVSRPHDRNFPHDAGFALARRPADRRAVVGHRRAVGRRVDEYRRDAVHGGVVHRRAAGARNTLGDRLG